MIETGKSEYIAGIKDCWKKSYTMEDPRWTEYYFRNIFKPENAIVDIQDDKVASLAVRQKHTMMFNGRALQVSMISGVSTLPEYRNKGLMHDVMLTMLDACSHSELITLIRSNKPDLVRQWGFYPIFYRSDYTLTRDDVKRITNFGCAYEPSPIDMLKVYSAFIRRFNGFYARDLEYFVQYKKEIAAQGGKIVAYYDGKNRIQGYASILLEGREARIEECIYLDSVALNKVLNAALQDRPIIHLHVSTAEKLSLVFPNAPKRDYVHTYARLNDADLFSRLYNANIETVEDAFNVSNRPLNINERY